MYPALIPESEIAALRELYDAGQYVSAWRRLETLPPVAQWREPAACTMAARILGNVEANRASHALHSRAWRLDRRNAESAYFRTYCIFHRLGPLRALRFIEKLPAFPDATPEIRSSFLALHASILSRFRDRARAEGLWERALAIDANQAWLWVERSGALEAFDAYDAALEAAQRALAIRPCYRPAVQSAAHLLGLLGRDTEAFTLLESASTQLQSPAVVAQLGALLVEHERHEEALVQWKRYRELAVAIEPAGLEWWHARMSNALYELGRLADAGEHARLAKNGFHDQIAERLSHPPAEARVVRLQVPFVRQHDMTCAPATLSALSRYWQMPVDHLQLAREICYDGTQSHRERHWAEQNGFVAREFTVTWEASVALLDRKIPFALTTVETRSAHLQAVMGYDAVRETLTLRDPYQKHPSEVIGRKWLESYAAVGPRGIVILPKSEASRLDEIALPDVELYDQLHIIERAVFLHERDRAQPALETLETNAPGHRITLEARREIAWYDQNQAASLAAIEGLLALAPGHNGLQWARYGNLQDLARHADRRELLGTMARSEKAEPLFWRELASDLRNDARKLPEARRWLLRALRYQPTDAEHLYAIAGVLWDEQRLEDALALYRLAASLRDKVEYLQRSWFIAARHLRQDAEVLTVLAERARHEGSRSSLPARTWYSALKFVGRDHEALAALDEAVARRPDDGELLCFAADSFARHAQLDRAQNLLNQAEGKCPRLLWLRTAATLADYRTDAAEALRLNQAALLETPLDVQLQDSVARLLAETQGRSAALAHLCNEISRFPHHLGLRQTYISWSRAESAAQCEAPLREFLSLIPDSAWAMRELALVLTDLNRSEEALALCDQAVALAPREESSHGIRGYVLLHAGRHQEASQSARDALQLSIDYTSAYTTLLEASPTFPEKQAALEFILRELERQVVFGDGLLQYLHHAFRLLEPDVVLTNLKEAHRVRPDLWHAWAALITQLCDMQKAAEAIQIACDAVDRFPLSARLWSDLARVHRERRNFAAEVEALQKASALNPFWGFLSRSLSEALQRVDRYSDAEKVLEHAIAAAPLEAENHFQLADLVWRQRRDPQAVVLLMQAIRLDPDHFNAWSALGSILPPGDDRAVALARDLTQKRAGEISPWLRLAEVLPASDLLGRLESLDRALSLNPRSVEAHCTRAWFLAEAGRYDEALQSCQPAVFGSHLPRELKSRAAWILAHRGNLPAAVEAMRAVVAADPDYYWAWERLAEWNDLLGNHQGERDAAEKMSRLAPRSPVPLGYLSDAMRKLGDAAGAIAVLKRAFALDPSYSYAGFTIFAEYLRTRDFSGAKATLTQLQQHLPGPHTVAAEVRLAAAERNKTSGLAAFEKLLTVPDAEVGALYSVLTPMHEAGWTVDYEKMIWDRRSDPHLNPATAACWVRGFAHRDRWDHRKKLTELDASDRFAQAAFREYANVCGEKQKRDYLLQFINQRREWLFNDDDAWGNIGYALVACDRPKQALEWFGEWKQRRNLRPWMLYNIAHALEDSGREDEAIEARRTALALPPDHTSPHHVTRLSLCEALRGDLPTAVARIDGLDYGRLDPRQKAEWAMVRTLADVTGGEPRDRARIYQGKRTLFYQNHPNVHQDAGLQRMLRRFELSLAQIAGVKPARPIRSRSHQPGGDSVIDSKNVVWIIIMVVYFVTRCASSSTPTHVPPPRDTNQFSR
jgi:tetratricopeptide (TPR) repeat protein